MKICYATLIQHIFERETHVFRASESNIYFFLHDTGVLDFSLLMPKSFVDNLKIEITEKKNNFICNLTEIFWSTV